MFKMFPTSVNIFNYRSIFQEVYFFITVNNWFNCVFLLLNALILQKFYSPINRNSSSSFFI